MNETMARRFGLSVLALAAGAAVGAAFAGCQPAGWLPADVVVTMALAAGLTLAATRARPWTWAVLIAPGLVLVTGWLLAVAVVAFAVVGVAVVRPPARPWQAALAVALGIQVLLRLPTTAHGVLRPTAASAAVVLVAVLPLVVSAWRHSDGGERRWLRRAAVASVAFVGLAVVGLGVAALSGRSGMQRGIFHAERGLDAAESGDQARAADELDTSASGFGQARQRFAAPWTWPARVVPVLGQYAAAASLAADAGHDVAAAGAAAARQVPYDQLSPHDGQVDLSLLRSVSAPVDAAATELEHAAGAVEGMDTTWLASPLTRRLDALRNDLRKTVPEARRAAEAIRLAPAMLGGDGTRHYLVLFANPSEARALGGYVGAYGQLTASAGKLELTHSGRTADLAMPAGVVPGPDPAGFEARYSRFQLTSHLGNVSASPDFGAVAVEAARLYGMALDTHFDGVLYVDPYGLAALLKLTGPISVAGLEDPLTEHNAAEFLLREQYTKFPERADRFDYLTEVSTATFHMLTNAKLPQPNKAFKALYPAVQSGRLRFVAFDPAENDLLGQAGLTGSFPQADGGDLIALRSSNTSPNKTDAFVHRSLRYEATVDPTAGTVDSVVTVRVTNDAPLGLPSYVLGNRDLMEGRAGARPFASNSSLVMVYSPLDLQGAQLDGVDVAMSSELDSGSHVYSASVTVPAGATSELRLQLHGQVDPGGGYRVKVVHQATVNDDDVAVVVHAPDRTQPDQDLSFALTEDRLLSFPIRAR